MNLPFLRNTRISSIEISNSTHHGDHFTDHERSDCGFLMVVLDVYVDQMHDMIQVFLTVLNICQSTTCNQYII